MSAETLSWAFQVRDVTPAEKLLLLVLGEEASMDGTVVWDQERLTAATCLSPAFLDSTVKDLMHRGLVSFGHHPEHPEPVLQLLIPGAWGVAS